MRDAHRIREQGAFGAVIAAVVRSVRTAALLAAGFAAGRYSAPVPPSPAPSAVALAPAPAGTSLTPAPVESPPQTQPPAAADPKGPGARLREASKDRKSKVLIASPEPGALPDGLLPEQTGSAKVGEYSVQIASFGSRQEARAFCQQLTRRGFHPHVAEARPSPQPHRVRLGRFCRRELAQAYRTRLAQADITASVVQVD